MRKFRITVNGTSYEVEVEEVGEGGAPTVATTPTASVKAAPSQPQPKAATPQPIPEPAKPAAPVVAAGQATVEAPMPGTILDIRVRVGDAVKAGSVLIILEAMKMENEIVAPQDGSVAEILTTKGASVHAGDTLVVLA